MTSLPPSSAPTTTPVVPSAGRVPPVSTALPLAQGSPMRTWNDPPTFTAKTKVFSQSHSPTLTHTHTHTQSVPPPAPAPITAPVMAPVGAPVVAKQQAPPTSGATTYRQSSPAPVSTQVTYSMCHNIQYIQLLFHPPTHTQTTILIHSLYW